MVCCTLTVTDVFRPDACAMTLMPEAFSIRAEASAPTVGAEEPGTQQAPFTVTPTVLEPATKLANAESVNLAPGAAPPRTASRWAPKGLPKSRPGLAVTRL